MNFACALVGGTGSGKTTYLRQNLLHSVHNGAIWLFDVNNEYPHLKMGVNRAKKFHEWIERIPLLRNSVIVGEDLTPFLSNRGREEIIITALTAKRHEHNAYIFLFHSLQDIPKNIYRLFSDVVLFRTEDEPAYVEKRFPKLYPHFLKVQEAVKTNPFYKSSPPPPGTKPNFIEVKLY